MKIIFKVGAFRADAPPDDVVLPRAGWAWHRGLGCWITSSVAHVAALHEFAEGEARNRVQAFIKAQRAQIAASAAPAADTVIPISARARDEGKDYRPYQKAGIAFKRARPFALNADSMRLGKTLQAIGVANTYPLGGIARMLVVCPANAKIHWVKEWNYWSVHADGMEPAYVDGSNNPASPFLVINYDILERHLDYLQAQPWDLVVFDESKNLRNPRAKRTAHCLGDLRAKTGGIRGSKHTFCLDGTPIWKSPIDLWPIVRVGDPHSLGRNYHEFARRYCGGPDADGNYDYKGASNEAELQVRLRKSIMLRREKTDVAAEIPPMRQTIVLAAEDLEPLARRERSIAEEALAGLEERLRQAQTPAQMDALLDDVARFDGRNDDPAAWDDEFVPLATARRELARAKVPHVVRFVEELLLNEPKVVVFAHHRVVVAALHEAFPGSARIWGGMSTAAREAERTRFQDDPDCHVIVGNITSMGSAIELSAADVEVFAELSFVPAELDQCEDRVWLPTKTTSIQVYRIVVRGTLEEAMVAILDKRQQAIERATVMRTLRHLSDSCVPS